MALPLHLLPPDVSAALVRGARPQKRPTAEERAAQHGVPVDEVSLFVRGYMDYVNKVSYTRGPPGAAIVPWRWGYHIASADEANFRLTGRYS